MDERVHHVDAGAGEHRLDCRVDSLGRFDEVTACAVTLRVLREVDVRVEVHPDERVDEFGLRDAGVIGVPSPVAASPIAAVACVGFPDADAEEPAVVGPARAGTGAVTEPVAARRRCVGRISRTRKGDREAPTYRG